jgi:sec-independent protein translocase protein TatA
MFDVGGGELLLIVLAILLLFGPKKIPELMQALGKGMRQFRKAQAEFQSQFNEIKSDIEQSAKVATNEVKSVKTAVESGFVPYKPEENTQINNSTQSVIDIDSE